jgi:hypothetical protein
LLAIKLDGDCAQWVLGIDGGSYLERYFECLSELFLAVLSEATAGWSVTYAAI